MWRELSLLLFFAHIVELAYTWSEDKGPYKPKDTSHHVHDAGTREIRLASRPQESATPRPVHHKRLH